MPAAKALTVTKTSGSNPRRRGAGSSEPLPNRAPARCGTELTTRIIAGPLAKTSPCEAVAQMRLPARRTAYSKQALPTGPSLRDQSVYLSPSLGAVQLGRKEMKISAKMRIISIISCVALLALNALSLLTAASRFHSYFSAASLVVALALLVAILVTRGEGPEPKRPKAEAAKPMPVPTANNQAEAEIVSFLATLQEQGRLIDFLMDDITTYDDGQVGAAARVVHQGCKAALQEHFRIRPVREESEGSSVTIAAGYPADEYRLIGKISGAAPFSGTLVHRGWKTESVKLPRIVRVNADRLPTIAPAEVELK